MDAKRIEAFWAKVDTSGGDTACWPWVGTRMRSGGYGQYSFRGPGGRLENGAHRAAYLFSSGLPSTNGLFVCHTCDNTRCCNPAHLWLGTHKENQEDKTRKKRGNQARGAAQASAKLTDEKVLVMRAQYAAGRTTQELCAEYGLAPQNVVNALTGRTWKHLGIVAPEVFAQLRQAHQSHGAGRPGAKLTDAHAIEIRRLYALGVSQEKLAKQFGVSRTTIQPLVEGRTWRHILPQPDKEGKASSL